VCQTCAVAAPPEDGVACAERPSRCACPPPEPDELVASEAQAIAVRLPHIMWKHIFTGAMGSTYFNLSVGMFLVVYGRMLGVGYRAFGILGGLSSFAVALQLVGAHLSARLGSRRPLWFACAMGERITRGLAIVAAYYLSRGNAAFAGAVFVGLLSLGSAFGALSTPPWYSWLADLIPADKQGSFWGRRETWVAFLTTVVLVPCAFFYDWGKAADLAIPALLTIFAVGLLVGYADLFIHNTIPEPRMRPAAVARLWPDVARVLKDRAFRPWLVFSVAWNFAMTLAASMCAIYFIDDLFKDSLTKGIIAVGVVPLVMNALTAKYTGALVDRWGTRRVLTWGHLVWALMPLPWLFARPDTALWLLAASYVVGMPAAAAAMNAGVKFVTRFPVREDRAMYWAVANTLAMLASGLSAVVAGEVLEAFEGTPLCVGAVAVGGFEMLFATSIVLRLLSVTLVRRLPVLACERRG
jgi:MFS family permease